MVAVLLLQPGLVGVEGVAVLHGELAHPQQAGARPRVVAPFRLQVVEELRQLPVRLDLPAHEVGDHLLVGHGEDHVPVRAVAEAAHLRVDVVPAAGLLPDVGRVHDRHGDLLPADGVDLLADDRLDLVEGAARQRQVAEDPARQLPDEAGPQQQHVAGDFGVGRGLAQRLAELGAHSHRQFFLSLRTRASSDLYIASTDTATQVKAIG